MRRIGYHASHEQFAPSRLLRLVRQAEAAGFNAAMCSDHLHPWSHAQGESGFAWAWLGAALQATGLSFGVVNAPGYRYHPAIVAQAAATLGEMYPGRHWVAVGSGEAMNEHVTGERWPPKPERNARLKECADVMRALWAGETVTHRGLVTVEGARVWSRPETPPLLVGAAISPETAGWMGAWADGLITVGHPPEKLREVIGAFREHGGAGKPLYVQLKVSWAETDEAALREAHAQWRPNVLGSDLLAELRTVEEFEQAAAFVRPEDLRGPVRISADPGRHAAWVEECFELGADAVYVHNVGPNQEAFLDAFGARVLPQFDLAPAARAA